MKGYVQGALRKELLVAPFEESFKATTLERSYYWILQVLGNIYLNIAFLPIFCWWKITHRVLYK